jgi:hypoxanthine phosphoribosyltransferase
MSSHDDSNVLISADQIRTRVTELAQQIAADYPAGEELHLVAVLKGAFMFLGDLIRAINRPLSIDFMAVSSYGTATTSSGESAC